MTPTADHPAVVTLPADYPAADLDPYTIEEAREIGLERLETRIPPRYAGAIADHASVAAWVRDLVDLAVANQRAGRVTVRRGPSLLLLGPTGSGKTHQAYGALRALGVSGAHCRWAFSAAADAYAEMRPRAGVDAETVFTRLAGAHVLVLDDLGAAKSSEWVEEVNYRLINHRYEHQMPTLITSNVPARQLAEAVGERVASRLTEMAHRVTLIGADRRRAPKNTTRGVA